MNDAPVQTSAQREELRLYGEILRNRERRRAEQDRSSAWLEIALAIGIGVAALLAVPAVLMLRPAAPPTLAQCPAPGAGEVLVIRIAPTTAGGPLEARCQLAGGRTKVAP